MGTEGWRDLWTFVFFAASLAFYTVVLIVAVKGFADVKAMVTSMVSQRRDNGPG